MRAVYKKSTGEYIDNEQSILKPPSDNTKLIEKLPNVLSKHGGSASDYVVFETDQPSLKKFNGSKLVNDTAKITSVSNAEAEAQIKADRASALRAKMQNQMATLKEVQEFLSMGVD